jgi:hypothetical protein
MTTRRFLIGFAIGLLSFILISLLAAHLASDCGLVAVFGRDSCTDDIARAGWPLSFYEEGGFDYHHTFNTAALWFDIGLGLMLAGMFGWLFSGGKKTPPK